MDNQHVRWNVSDLVCAVGTFPGPCAALWGLNAASGLAACASGGASNELGSGFTCPQSGELGSDVARLESGEARPSESEGTVELEFDSELDPAAAEPDGLEVDVDTTDAPPDGAFGQVLRSVREVLEAYGAVASARAVVPFAVHGVISKRSLPETVCAELIRSGLAEVHGEDLRASAWLGRAVSGWRGVLSGECSDLSVCGETTLDRFAAQLGAALLGTSSRTDELRRELRRKGVAAFGVLAAA